MIKIENIGQIDKIKEGDIVVMYPFEGTPIDSFAGRNLENSIAYEVANKNDSNKIINLVIPAYTNSSSGGEGENTTTTALQKPYEALVAEKVWWVAKY